MQSAFPFVVFGGVALFIVIGLLSAYTHRDLYDEIGAGGLTMGESGAGAGEGTLVPEPDSPSLRAEREREIRQMLQARSERRVRQGEAPLDIDAEFARIEREQDAGRGAAGADAGLAEEVRQLVLARNERRARQGQERLDVEEEVRRTLAELEA